MGEPGNRASPDRNVTNVTPNFFAFKEGNAQPGGLATRNRGQRAPGRKMPSGS